MYFMFAVGLKKKHQDAIHEMSEQIEQLNKMKGRWVKLNKCIY